jgi:hypothetical protein
MADIDMREAGCQKALANVRRFLRADVKFAENPFSGEWASYLFLESDRMFVGNFVIAVKQLLALEGARAACMVNLDRDRIADSEASAFCLDECSSPEKYFEAMSDPWGGFASRERFGCSSDIGSWCFYCENLEDVGVVAIRNAADVVQFCSPLERLDAMPFDIISDKAREESKEPFITLLPEWREAFERNFAGSI